MSIEDLEDDIPTPTLEELLRMAVDDALFNLATSMPGVVDSFDPSTGSCSVQPALMRSYDGVTKTNLPVLTDVPVMYPSSSMGRVTFPLAKGDPVWLIFSHRSLENWKAKGGVVDPNDPRRHHLSDAVCFPGTRSLASPLTDISASAMRISYGNTTIELQDGKILFKGQSAELIDVLISITAQLSTIAAKLGLTTTNTAIGPQPLAAAADFTSAQTAIDALKDKLTGLKG